MTATAVNTVTNLTAAEGTTVRLVIQAVSRFDSIKAGAPRLARVLATATDEAAVEGFMDRLPERYRAGFVIQVLRVTETTLVEGDEVVTTTRTAVVNADRAYPGRTSN